MSNVSYTKTLACNITRTTHVVSFGVGSSLVDIMNVLTQIPMNSTVVSCDSDPDDEYGDENFILRFLNEIEEVHNA